MIYLYNNIEQRRTRNSTVSVRYNLWALLVNLVLSLVTIAVIIGYNNRLSLADETQNSANGFGHEQTSTNELNQQNNNQPHGNNNHMVRGPGPVIVTNKILEEGSQYILNIPITDVDKTQIKVKVHDKKLSISTNKDDNNTNRHPDQYHESSLELPSDIDVSNISSSYKNNILTILMPKSEKKESSTNESDIKNIPVK